VFSCSNVLLTAFAIFKYVAEMPQRDIERVAGRKHDTKRLRRRHWVIIQKRANIVKSKTVSQVAFTSNLKGR